MSDTIQIPYSKNFGYFGLTLVVGLIIMSLPYLIKDIKANDFYNWSFVATFDCLFLLIGLVFVFKFFIPALKGVTALELNNDALVDNIRHRKIYWNNVSGIRTVSSGSSLGIAIDIKDMTKVEEKKNLFNKFQSFLAQLFFGTPVVIADKFIKGSDKEIFAQIIVYFEQRKNCT